MFVPFSLSDIIPLAWQVQFSGRLNPPLLFRNLNQVVLRDFSCKNWCHHGYLCAKPSHESLSAYQRCLADDRFDLLCSNSYGSIRCEREDKGKPTGRGDYHAAEWAGRECLQRHPWGERRYHAI
jgi:hypothetical protein